MTSFATLLVQRIINQHLVLHPQDASLCESIFKFSMISTFMVFSLLSKLDVTKSVGFDGFLERFLKKLLLTLHCTPFD